jgi:hypothetical protein
VFTCPRTTLAAEQRAVHPVRGRGARMDRHAATRRLRRLAEVSQREAGDRRQSREETRPECYAAV